MSGANKCPKCGGSMSSGQVVECTEGQSRPIHPGVINTWMETPAAHAPSNLVIPVMTYRCSACGFLESYANSAK